MKAFFVFGDLKRKTQNDLTALVEETAGTACGDAPFPERPFAAKQNEPFFERIAH